MTDCDSIVLSVEEREKPPILEENDHDGLEPDTLVPRRSRAVVAVMPQHKFEENAWNILHSIEVTPSATDDVDITKVVFQLSDDRTTFCVSVWLKKTETYSTTKTGKSTSSTSFSVIKVVATDGTTSATVSDMTVTAAEENEDEEDDTKEKTRQKSSATVVNELFANFPDTNSAFPAVFKLVLSAFKKAAIGSAGYNLDPVELKKSSDFFEENNHPTTVKYNVDIDPNVWYMAVLTQAAVLCAALEKPHYETSKQRITKSNRDALPHAAMALTFNAMVPKIIRKLFGHDSKVEEVIQASLGKPVRDLVSSRTMVMIRVHNTALKRDKAKAAFKLEKDRATQVAATAKIQVEEATDLAKKAEAAAAQAKEDLVNAEAEIANLNEKLANVENEYKQNVEKLAALKRTYKQTEEDLADAENPEVRQAIQKNLKRIGLLVGLAECDVEHNVRQSKRLRKKKENVDK